jgi:hypothetical protein
LYKGLPGLACLAADLARKTPLGFPLVEG